MREYHPATPVVVTAAGPALHCLTAYLNDGGEPEPDVTVREVSDRCVELLALSHRRGDLPDIGSVLCATVYLLVAPNVTVAERQAFSALARRYAAWVDVLAEEPSRLAAALGAVGVRGDVAARIRGVVLRAHEAGARGNDWSPGPAPSDVREALGVSESFARRVVDLLGDAEDPAECAVRVRRRLGVPAGVGSDGDPDFARLGRLVCGPRRRRCGECVLVSFCPDRFAGSDRRWGNRNAVDLFAGAGGLSVGFRREGFAIVGAVEADRATAQTYRLNHPGTPVVEADVRSLTGATLRGLLGLGSAPVRVVLAGPPCQGYSRAGTRTPDDGRNALFREVVRLSGDLAADWVVMENVPGLRRVRGVNFQDAIVAALSGAGYRSTSVHALTATDFGVAQKRRRLFFVANRAGVTFAEPAATHRPPGDASGALSPTPTLLDVLAGLPHVGVGGDVDGSALPDGRPLLNGAAMRHSAAVVDKIRSIPPGGGPISYRRLYDDAARTLIAGHRGLPVHPRLHRAVTVREAARIQGLDDGFVFCGVRSGQPLMVANVVPPPLAAAVARQVRDADGIGD